MGFTSCADDEGSAASSGGSTLESPTKFSFLESNALCETSSIFCRALGGGVAAASGAKGDGRVGGKDYNVSSRLTPSF